MKIKVLFEKYSIKGVACAKGAVVTMAPKNPLGHVFLPHWVTLRLRTLALINRRIEPAGSRILGANDPWAPGTQWVCMRLGFPGAGCPLGAPATLRPGGRDFGGLIWVEGAGEGRRLKGLSPQGPRTIFLFFLNPIYPLGQ